MEARKSTIQDLFSWLMILVCFLPPAAFAIDVTIETDTEKWVVSDRLMSLHITYDSPKGFLLNANSTLVGETVNLAGWAGLHGVKSARFPGGTVIKNWDWQTGGDPQEDPWDPNYDPRNTDPANEWSIDEYLQFVADAGMEPHLGINNLSGVKFKARFQDSIDRAAALVQYVVDAGHPGAIYYIGNEEDHIQGGEYAAMHIDKLHAQAMKAVDPTCKIIWNTQGYGAGHVLRMLNLNDGWLDGVETHTKWPWGSPPANPPTVNFATWQTTTPMKDHKTGRIHRNVANSLHGAAAKMGYPNFIVANNEYGGGKSVAPNDFKLGLIMTEQIAELFIGNYDMSAYWNFTAMLQMSNPHPRMKAIHLAWEMLGDAQGATMLKMTDDGVHTPGFAVKTDDDIQLFLLNKSSASQPVTVDFTGVFAVQTGATALAMVDTADHWGRTRAVTVNHANGTFSANLPALSFTEITFPLADRTETNAPAVPTGLTATYLDGNGFMRLNWTDNPEGDLHDYRVYRSRYPDRDFKVFNMDVSNSVLTDTTAVTGVDYYYKVSAIDTNGNESAASAAVRGRMPRFERVVAVDFEMCDPGTNTDAANLNTGTVGGSWNRVPAVGADIRKNSPVYANYYHPVNQALRIDGVGAAFSPQLMFDSAISRDGVEIRFDATTIRAGDESKNIKVRVMNDASTLCTIVLSVGLSGLNHRLCYLDNSGTLRAFPEGSQGDLNDAGTAYDPPLDTVRIFLTDTGFSAALLEKGWVSAEVPYTGSGANISKIRFGGAAPAGFWLDNLRVNRILPPDDGSRTAPAFASDPFTVPDVATIAQHYQKNIASFASDVDGDTLAFSRVSGPSWLRIREDGTIYGTPPVSGSGTEIFQVKVEDPYGDFDVAEMRVDVSNTNLEAAFHGDPIVKGSGFTGIPYSGSLAGDASDGNGDPMTFSKISGSAWLSVAANGTLSGTPGGAHQLHQFTVGVTDGIGGTNTTTLHIHVLPNNSPTDGVLIGFETFDDPASTATWDPTTIMTNISGSVTHGAGAGGFWRDAAFVNAGSTDLTFGSDYPGAAANAGVLTDSVRSHGDTTNLDVLVKNDGTDDLNLESFHFDAWRAVSNGATDWSLEVLPGSSVTTGAVLGAGLVNHGAQPSNSDFDDFDVAFTGLADNTLAPDESATFRFTLNNASSNGAVLIDNVAVAGRRVNVAPVWDGSLIVKADATSRVLYNESLTDDASDLNPDDTLTFIMLSGPSWLSVASDGGFSGIPSDDDVGVSSAQIEVSDGSGGTAVATIEVPVLELGTFADWLALYGLFDPTIDQDFDSLLPLMEYALGGNPTSGVDAAVRPTVGFAPDGSYRYIYRRRRDAVARGLAYTVKRSTNLTDWSASGCVEIDSEIIDAEFERVTIQIDSGDRVFVRLELSLDE